MRHLDEQIRVRPRRFGAFGRESRIGAPVTIWGMSDAIRIGERVSLARGATLSVIGHHLGRDYDPHLSFGDGCSFGEQLFISCCGTITIGRDVMGSARVTITDSYHGYEDPAVPPIYQPLATPRPVTIGDGVFLGIGSVILPGVTLGERVYVGANAVVTHDVESWTMVAGNPACAIKRWDGVRWVRCD